MGVVMVGVVGEIVVVLALASFVSGLAGDAIFVQSYNFSSADGGTFYESLADDFTPDFTGEFTYVVMYQYFDTARPAEVFVKITRDNGDVNPNSSTALVSGSFPVSYVATGDSLEGFSVCEMTIDLGQTVAVDAGDLYWLETGMIYNSWLLYQDPVVFGSPMWYFEGGQYHCFSEQSHSWDSFFELRTPVALQRSSWGSIKASF
jgi:hypothetical protein